MKRFHVHVSVDNLANSVAFYSKLFGAMPSKHEADYAKWMLEDPRLNFAISVRGHKTGVNHFGMQVESQNELAALKVLADSAARGEVIDQGAASCCYANSEKHWVMDPQGIAWEHFHTMGAAQTYGEDIRPRADAAASACCVPTTVIAAPASIAAPVATSCSTASCGK
jgi:catechol 2,3-dioxygenase-like lactoylglutathione lyase family enzyme